MRKILYIFLGAVAFSIPLVLAAQVTPTQAPDTQTPPSPTAPVTAGNDGILNCNRTGAYAQSVGAFASSGIYVPVNDSAVTLNTGYLVYLQCTLRPIVDRLRERATAEISAQTERTYLTGRDGNPQFSRNYLEEGALVRDNQFVKSINIARSVMPPAFSTQVTRTIAQQWVADNHNPYNDLVCENTPSPSNSALDNIGIYISDQACYPLGSYELARQHITRDTDSAYAYMMTQLEWGNGVYPQTEIGEDGVERTVTPAIIVNAIANQSFTSGFRQTESANDIGQMVSSFFTAMGAQIMGSAQGLSSLTQNTGQGSYLDRITQGASQGVIGAVANAALQTLLAARQVEVQYYTALSGMSEKLTQSIQRVRSVERTCWENIIAAACTGSASSTPTGGTCTTSGGTTLRIATSTVRSDAFISANLTTNAQQVLTLLTNSRNAVNQIDTLITQVSNTSSQSSQTLALTQFNQLVAQGTLHNQNDLANLTTARQAVDTVYGGIFATDGSSRLSTEWGYGVTDPSTTGYNQWCAVSNPAVITAWQNAWSK